MHYLAIRPKLASKIRPKLKNENAYKSTYPLTNFSYQNEILAEFTTLEDACHAVSSNPLHRKLGPSNLNQGILKGEVSLYH
jgi:hypothetical protein